MIHQTPISTVGVLVLQISQVQIARQPDHAQLVQMEIHAKMEQHLQEQLPLANATV